jgi:hypothetical protein
LINPALMKAYALAQGSLVDVTKATGGYIPLTRTVRYRPYGTIPAAVASVCTLTWFCAQGNIHATTKGYILIGKLVVARYNMPQARAPAANDGHWVNPAAIPPSSPLARTSGATPPRALESLGAKAGPLRLAIVFVLSNVAR